MRVVLRKKSLKDSRQSYYLDIYYLGKRKYEYLSIYIEKNDPQKKEKASLANKIRAFREIELANIQHGYIPSFKKRASLLKFVEKIANSKSSQRDYKAMYIHLRDYAKSDIKFQEVDEKWIDGFKEYLLKKVMRNTASTYFMKLKYCFKQARKENIIVNDITERTKNISGEDVEREFLTQDEITLLAKTNCQVADVKRAFLFSCFTGLRFSDIKKLNWGNIVNNTIKLRQQKTNDLVNIPLGSTALSILNKNLSNIVYFPDTLIFSLPETQWTNIILKRWFKEAQIKKKGRYHISRHTFATLNITKGAELYTVSKLLGHKSIKNTEIYANLVDEKKIEAIDRLPDIALNE